jgi:hypothetical protein
MRRHLSIGLLFILAACANQPVRTQDQAIRIAKSSACAQHEVNPDPNLKMPMVWLAERSGDRWIAWHQFGETSAWINASDGKILSCDNGAPKPVTGLQP